jgi:hypothetical protein
MTAGCPKMNKLAIDRFRFGIQWCFQKAVDLGMSIAVTPRKKGSFGLGSLLELAFC